MVHCAELFKSATTDSYNETSTKIQSFITHAEWNLTTGGRTHLNEPPLPRVNLFPMPPPRPARVPRPPREVPRPDPETCAVSNKHKSNTEQSMAHNHLKTLSNIQLYDRREKKMVWAYLKAWKDWVKPQNTLDCYILSNQHLAITG
jgi:hypothetical protein